MVKPNVGNYLVYIRTVVDIVLCTYLIGRKCSELFVDEYWSGKTGPSTQEILNSSCGLYSNAVFNKAALTQEEKARAP